jgi:hypothetical protein
MLMYTTYHPSACRALPSFRLALQRSESLNRH